MRKEEIKKILEDHLLMISKISDDEELLKENPILMSVVTESLKTTSLTLLFADMYQTLLIKSE